MKFIVDIPEEDYNKICTEKIEPYGATTSIVYRAFNYIKNSVPYEETNGLSAIEEKAAETQFPLGFDIKDLDSLEETAELIFNNHLGTAEISVGDFDYLVLQFDMNKDAKDQRFDVYAKEDTLGRQVTFEEMIQAIKDNIGQHIQMGR